MQRTFDHINNVAWVLPRTVLATAVVIYIFSLLFSPTLLLLFRLSDFAGAWIALIAVDNFCCECRNFTILMKLNVIRLFRFALSIKRNQTISSFSTFLFFFLCNFRIGSMCVFWHIHIGSWLNHHQMGLCTMCLCTSTLCASEYFNPLRNVRAAIIINTYYLHSIQRTHSRPHYDYYLLENGFDGGGAQFMRRRPYKHFNTLWFRSNCLSVHFDGADYDEVVVRLRSEKPLKMSTVNEITAVEISFVRIKACFGVCMWVFARCDVETADARMHVRTKCTHTLATNSNEVLLYSSLAFGYRNRNASNFVHFIM